MNPSGGEWKTRSTTSPALFNRCVVDWFGSWSPKAMGEVGKEFTMKLDMGDAEGVGGSWGIGDGEHLMDQVSAAFDGINTGGFRQALLPRSSVYMILPKIWRMNVQILVQHAGLI